MLAFIPGGMPGMGELGIILLIVFLLFGAKKLPQMANSFGRSLTEFRRGRKEGEKLLKELEQDIKEISSDTETK